VLVRHLPADSATRRTIDSDGAVWGLQEQLLAAAVDALSAGNWQRGGKGPRPKRLPRPGVDSKQRRHFGRPTNHSPHEVAEYLARFKPPLLD
jgi:hypothetical protein